MKTLALLIILSILMMFSSTSYAEWRKISESVDGISYYVDFKRIRKHGGYIYFWQLSNYSKPNNDGNLSAKKYSQGDCKQFRYKILSSSYHKEPMGRGRSDGQDPVKKGWKYPHPNSVIETSLIAVCRFKR
jgi:hypothetical protein